VTLAGPMGTVSREHCGADFKAKVALEAIRGDSTLAELAAKHRVHQTAIAGWKRQAIDGMTATFSGKSEAAKTASEAGVAKWHAKIGQLVVERDILSGELNLWTPGALESKMPLFGKSPPHWHS